MTAVRAVESSTVVTAIKPSYQTVPPNLPRSATWVPAESGCDTALASLPAAPPPHAIARSAAVVRAASLAVGLASLPNSGRGRKRSTLPQIPELLVQPKLLEKRHGFVNGPAPPFGSAAIGEPGPGQTPGQVQGQHRAASKTPSLAPAVDVLFRPEEKHRLSGKNDVGPPLLSGDREMDEAFVRHAS
jgi:hypothetical protein